MSQDPSLHTIRNIHIISIHRSMEERTLVHFSENPVHILEAYADSGEGVDRAGGFAIQVRSSNFHICMTITLT